HRLQPLGGGGGKPVGQQLLGGSVPALPLHREAIFLLHQPHLDLGPLPGEQPSGQPHGPSPLSSTAWVRAPCRSHSHRASRTGQFSNFPSPGTSTQALAPRRGQKLPGHSTVSCQLSRRPCSRVSLGSSPLWELQYRL